MILQEVFAPVDEMKPLSKEQMDAMDKAREDDDFVLPELEKPEPGFFDGMGEASWKGVASSALKSASAFDTALSSTGVVRAALQNAEVETGYAFEDIDQRTSAIENRVNQDSKELRRRAKEDYGIDPTTMGTAAQIVYGVAETIPKAIGYSLLAGPVGGSVLFGADLGISRTQELMDEGVDQNTAINAGLVTFGAAALGMRLPATFGRSRIASATIGAAANAGLTAAEMQGVNWVLQNQNYSELAQKYQLNAVDLAVSGIFGGVMGGVLWRPGMNNGRPQTAQERSIPLQERIKRQLREASPERLTDEQFEQMVVQAYGSVDSYKETIKNQYILQAYLMQEKGEELNNGNYAPASSDVETFYRRNATNFTQAENVKFAQIYMAKTGDASADSQKLSTMQRVASDIQSGKMTFEAAVNQYTEDEASKADGGVMGWLSSDNTVVRQLWGDDFVDTVLSLPLGATSDVIESLTGYHIVKVTVHNDARLLGLDDRIQPDVAYTVRDYITEYLAQVNMQSAMNQALNDMVETLRSEARIRVIYSN